MKSFICKIIRCHDAVFNFCEQYLTAFLLLGIRLWLAYTFFFSGYSKFLSWSTTLYLFEYEYNVPLLSYEVAAYLATGVELIFSVLLAIGLFSRLSMIPILVLQLVTLLTYPGNIATLYWYFLMATIICYGGGAISLDFVLTKLFKKK